MSISLFYCIKRPDGLWIFPTLSKKAKSAKNKIMPWENLPWEHYATLGYKCHAIDLKDIGEDPEGVYEEAPPVNPLGPPGYKSWRETETKYIFHSLDDYIAAGSPSNAIIKGTAEQGSDGKP